MMNESTFTARPPYGLARRLSVAALLLAAGSVPVSGQVAGETGETSAQAADACPVPAQLIGDLSEPLATVRYLSDDALDGRLAGSPGELCAGEYLAARFHDLGLGPAGVEGTYFQDVPLASVTNPHAPAGTGRNVVARLNGADPALDDEILIIGAHYDHLGMGGFGSMEEGVRAIHNGADDNASGTAALLEVARQMAERKDELKRDVIFMAFSAEERGLVGASNIVRRPPEGLVVEEIVAMVNMDMVGRLRDDRLDVLGSDSAEEWDDIVTPMCDQYGFECKIGGDGFGSSDQSAFFAADVPVLHLFTGTHADYHKSTDDAHLLNAEGAVRIAWMVSDVAGSLANRDGRLTLVKTSDGPQRQRMALKARLGTIPDYAGPPDGAPGLLLSDVRPDSPADQAGLQRGDIIVRIGEREIVSIQDYMAVLAEANPGDTDSVVVLRDGEPVELEVTFGAPR